ncbi:glutathione S-transferase family protein [Variovorax sp. J22P240]|uniref:glutathione S-transferase family protein n=1 Tax=unclassified Variovorax TaxID=663243 RepID=UPI00257770A6|nr:MULTISPECIES: glutathione S-transferase family protein [unclassified Variovorax]MDM0002274.1 glutathione S-transferase family protein [Variovorax sp. J22P240]MDM0047793.1 glutathione S-transferase family protein [Variovorax sp. J22R115]
MAPLPFVLYGAPGSGATPVHAALILIGAPVKVMDFAPWQGDIERTRLASARPMRQVPMLVHPSGEIMAESAAMLIWLADRYPDAGLAPRFDDPARAPYLRWMSFVSSTIHSLYWMQDDACGRAGTAQAKAIMLDQTAEKIAQRWRFMDAQVPRGGRYLLGESLTVLDLYVTVVSRWEPRRLRFYREAPRMAEVVRRVDTEPRLLAHWSARYPFAAAWESEGP